mmetsp:Transcript_61141/g.122565  ORF Transcript_61141/g.122565 Transcript_61141/m.122565 type:complete len:219 (-) Transcript_61141:345-1001(-)
MRTHYLASAPWFPGTRQGPLTKRGTRPCALVRYLNLDLAHLLKSHSHFSSPSPRKKVSTACSSTFGSTWCGYCSSRLPLMCCSASVHESAFLFPAQARRATPFITSQWSIWEARRAASEVPSKTSWKPPLTDSPHPVPPPLCSATEVAPRQASPIALWTAMSAQNLEPSSMFEVSRHGLSVPLTSWWSRLKTTGAVSVPLPMASLRARAILTRASALA